MQINIASAKHKQHLPMMSNSLSNQVCINHHRLCLPQTSIPTAMPATRGNGVGCKASCSCYQRRHQQHPPQGRVAQCVTQPCPPTTLLSIITLVRCKHDKSKLLYILFHLYTPATQMPALPIHQQQPCTHHKPTSRQQCVPVHPHPQQCAHPFIPPHTRHCARPFIPPHPGSPWACAPSLAGAWSTTHPPTHPLPGLSSPLLQSLPTQNTPRHCVALPRKHTMLQRQPCKMAP